MSSLQQNPAALQQKTGGNTSNLRGHIELKHPAAVGKKRKTQMDEDKVGAVPESVPSTSASRPVVEKKSKMTSVAEKESITTPPSPKPTASQSRISEAFAKITSFKQGDTSIKITQAIVYMICIDAEPISIVEHAGFRHLMKTVAPLYVVPSRQSVRSLIIDKYNYISEAFKRQLSAAVSYTLTTDIWTDRQHRSFLGVTAHYFDIKKNDNYVEKGVLGLFDLHERHTSTYISEQFEKICMEWDLDKKKIVAVVSDNAANIVKAVDQTFAKKHLPCFAHTLNLIASKGIENVDALGELLKIVKSIVSWFHHSVTASDELRKVTDRKLIQDVPTRWNSTYEMLKRFLELRPFVNEIVNRVTSAPPMTSALQIEMLQDVIHVLGPLEAATREISGEHFVTSSLAIPVASILFGKLSDLKPIHPIGKALKDSILAEHKKRFGAIEYVQLLAISTVLDPRFKREYFRDKVACAKAVSVIKNLFLSLSASQQSDSPSSQSTDSDTESCSLFKDHNKKIQSLWQRKKRASDVSVPEELSLYLNSPNEKFQQSTVGFWVSMKNTYPTLFDVVLQNVPVVASSVPSERLFSQAGIILNTLRNRLSEDLAVKLLFLKEKNPKYWGL